jgi:hypothetical protein
MAWTTDSRTQTLLGITYDEVFDRSGQVINDVKLSGSPVYFLKKND